MSPSENIWVVTAGNTPFQNGVRADGGGGVGVLMICGIFAAARPPRRYSCCAVAPLRQIKKNETRCHREVPKNAGVIFRASIARSIDQKTQTRAEFRAVEWGPKRSRTTEEAGGNNGGW
jgi:hypothetical protein